MAGIFIVWTVVRCVLNPSLGPPLPPAERAIPLPRLVRELTFGMVPHLVLTAVTLGPILAGMATPTEAAGVGVVGTLLMAFALPHVLVGQLKTASSRRLSSRA